jgi:hypothetical protein
VAVLGRNGVDLRPILRGLAEGTIEYTAAISKINIERLEQADKEWKKIEATMRVVGADLVAATGGKLADDIRRGTAATGASFGLLAGIGAGAWETIKNAATGHFTEAKENLEGLGHVFKNIITGTELKKFNETFDGLEAGADTPAADLPPVDTGGVTEDQLTKKRAERVEAAKIENEVLSAQLNRLDAIAKALEIHAAIGRKIAEAQHDKNAALVSELQLQEKLSLRKLAEDIAGKNADRPKLSLKELAEAGPIGSGRFFSEATLQARRAQREEALGEQERLAQHPEAALRHFDLAEQIKSNIPQLRDNEKDISGQVRMGVESASVFREMIGKMDTILNLFTG